MKTSQSNLRDSHPLWRSFPRNFSPRFHWQHFSRLQLRNTRASLIFTLSRSLFIRHYLGNHCYFLFHHLIICLNSVGYLVWFQVLIRKFSEFAEAVCPPHPESFPQELDSLLFAYISDLIGKRCKSWDPSGCWRLIEKQSPQKKISAFLSHQRTPSYISGMQLYPGFSYNIRKKKDRSKKREGSDALLEKRLLTKIVRLFLNKSIIYLLTFRLHSILPGYHQTPPLEKGVGFFCHAEER